jgi:hypothetical protein
MWCSRIVVAAMLCASPSGAPAEDAPKAKPSGKAAPAEAKSALPKGRLDLDKLRPSLKGYARKLEVHADDQESAGVTASVRVVPDAFRYKMAVGFEELEKASYGTLELEKKLKALLAENRKYKGKALYLVSLSSDGGKNNHFIQSPLKNHVVLSGKSKKTIGTVNSEYKPGFVAWRVFEQKANERNMLTKKLSTFTKLAFEFTSDWKESDKDPLTLSVINLVRVTDRREEQKSDYRAFEGINTSLKQISSSDWASQTVPTLSFKLYPGKWDVPEPPPAFEELLALLEKGQS